MNVCKTIGDTLRIWSFSCFYTFLVSAREFFMAIFKGKTYLNIKPRPTPPSCLTDETLGKHGYVKLKEVKLHYVEAGDSSKPLVLLLHGFPEFWYSWRHQLKHLKDDFRTVAVDMRGYGDSDKPAGVRAYTIEKLVDDIEELIQALGHSKCYLVAHDWGGIIAWNLALKSPSLIEKLIIINASHPVAFFELIQTTWRQFMKSWYMYFFQMPWLPEFLLSLNDLQFFEKMFYSHPKGKEVFCHHDIEAYKYTFSKRSDFTAPMNYYRNLRPSFYAEIKVPPKIDLPVLIIWGMDDIALQSELATMSSQLCENCNVKFVKGASHWIPQDSPTVVNTYISEFLKGKED